MYADVLFAASIMDDEEGVLTQSPAPAVYNVVVDWVQDFFCLLGTVLKSHRHQQWPVILHDYE